MCRVTHPDGAAEERARGVNFPLGGGGRGHLRAGLPLLLPHAVPVHAATTTQHFIKTAQVIAVTITPTTDAPDRLALFISSNQILDS